MSTPDEIRSKVYQLSVAPFVLERRGEFESAIDIHKNAADVLGQAAEAFKKNGTKANRKMFERQAELHRERLAYLEGLKQKGSFDGIIRPPTFLDLADELKRDEKDSSPWTLSQIRKALYEYQKDDSPKKEIPDHLKPFIDVADTTKIPFFTATLPSNPETVKYCLSHSSDLVYMGIRSHWWFVKDATNTHVLYAGQCEWNNEMPIVQTKLRRAGEFLPEMGAVNVKIRKQKKGSFRLETRTVPDSGAIIEIPDGEQERKDWSPRRFKYGGRNFVWKTARPDGKCADGGLFKSLGFEVLYETKRVWPKNGGKPGIMEDETVGPKLFWGEKDGVNGASHTLYLAAGLDQMFTEHILAAQLARFMRCSYPPNKDTKGVEAVAAGVGLLTIAELISS
ncbi:hypothetical protein BJY04DRAFT_168149 [Aspergillus karnatakaensis]|uniref:uncharacterized protein n=1 Tax=Aspergillus karnatakaensis TaxID=1810916 RepID=UPI003CCD494D